jgi:hypothetical protein
MVPVADLFNFRDNPGSRKFGMALIVDLIRLPLIDRRDRNNAVACMKQNLRSGGRARLSSGLVHQRRPRPSGLQ